MSSAISDLVEILTLERLEHNLFRGRSPQVGWQRVFGGLVISQALRAASATVDGVHHPHSLHAYFLLGGDPAAPIIYEVDRIREGRSFVTRGSSRSSTGRRFSRSLPRTRWWKRGSRINSRCRTCQSHPNSRPRMISRRG